MNELREVEPVTFILFKEVVWFFWVFFVFSGNPCTHGGSPFSRWSTSSQAPSSAFCPRPAPRDLRQNDESSRLPNHFSPCRSSTRWQIEYTADLTTPISAKLGPTERPLSHQQCSDRAWNTNGHKLHPRWHCHRVIPADPTDKPLSVDIELWPPAFCAVPSPVPAA